MKNRSAPSGGLPKWIQRTECACAAVTACVTALLLIGCNRSPLADMNEKPKATEVTASNQKPEEKEKTEVPKQSDIDAGVNWALSGKIRWTDTSTNLFDVYKITNQYVEEADRERRFVYDFRAECLVVQTETAYEAGSGGAIPSQLFQTFGNVQRKRVVLDGTFTLVKKGEKWYCKETIR
jgi:hypothetical protein